MKIVAITACPTGVAHTYMSAEKLEQAAKKMGYKINVEKQGAMGIEDRLSPKDIEEADLVILAVETAILEEERFNGKRIFRCPVAAPIKKKELIFEEAETKAVVEVAGNGGGQSTQKVAGKNASVKTHIMTGISYIIPIAVGASVVMGIARMLGMLIGVTEI
jgi:fructose-specific phosphotransferase system IIB component